MPPARDEESETQRKAHAKRVRETRRSTQGVTLEEIKSAEELVKKKNLNNNNNSSSNNNNNNVSIAYLFASLKHFYIHYAQNNTEQKNFFKLQIK